MNVDEDTKREAAIKKIIWNLSDLDRESSGEEFDGYHDVSSGEDTDLKLDIDPGDENSLNVSISFT